MILNSLRLLAFVILFAIIIIKDIPFKKIFKDAILQLYIAIFCIAILLIIDNITGFIITLAVLILYFRVYSEEIKKKNELEEKNKEDSPKEQCKHKEQCTHKEHKEHKEHNETCNKCTLDIPKKKSIMDETDNSNGYVPYISEEHLLAAQTNIIDTNNYHLNIDTDDLHKLDLKRGPLYKIQGLPDSSDLNGEINHIRGYDISNEYLGSLSYDIL
jgi:Ca2+/Na+ antiporter